MRILLYTGKGGVGKTTGERPDLVERLADAMTGGEPAAGRRPAGSGRVQRIGLDGDLAEPPRPS